MEDPETNSGFPQYLEREKRTEKEKTVEEGETKRKQYDQHTAKFSLEPHVHSGNDVNLTVLNIYNQLLEYFGYCCQTECIAYSS